MRETRMLNAHAEHITITDALAWDCLEGECEHVTDEVDDTSNCPRIEVVVCVDCMDEHKHGRDPHWWEDLIPWPCDPASRLGVVVYECDRRGPKGFWCVRPLDHDRDHVATNGQEILDVWAQEPADR